MKQKIRVGDVVVIKNTNDVELDNSYGKILGIYSDHPTTKFWIVGLDKPYNGNNAIVLIDSCLSFYIKETHLPTRLKLDEVQDIAYLNYQVWETLWLTGKTDWWPDSLEDKIFPPTKYERIQFLRDNNRQYIVHVDSGVHAFKVGFIDEIYKS